MSDPSFVPQPHSVQPSGSDLVQEDTDGDLHEEVSSSLPAQAYRLTVNADGAKLTAGSQEGLVSGRATWSQLLDAASAEPGGGVRVPGLHIEDAPRHSWRGLMVDCSRHFTPIAELKKIIDLLALHRMNRLHLHLTDDQGWRVQIDGWPLLTEVGATRNRTLVGPQSTSLGPEANPDWDERPYSGFYTQQELRDLVSYALDRGVTLVPEVDLPGHMQAAIAAYPQLGNLDHPIEVRGTWGISEHVLAPTSEAMRFVRDVLGQVMDIFPGQWVHIGGDECPTVEWEHSAQAQQFMAERALDTERQIQREFLRVADEVISVAGRTLIGWDEILQADPPEGAVPMLWRPQSSIADAQAHQLDCIYAHCSSLYFDYPQGDVDQEPLAMGEPTTLAEVYATAAALEDLPTGHDELLLGVQAQLWREYIATDEHLEYMLLPRLCALSEVAWGTATDYSDFRRRLSEHHLARLAARGANYRPLD